MKHTLNTGCTMPKLKAKPFVRSELSTLPLLLLLDHDKYVALATLAQHKGYSTIEYATKLLGRAIDKKLLAALKS